MRFLHYLDEEFETYGKADNDPFPIFKNPTRKELKELDNPYGIRFIVDTKKKDLYCFAGGVLHIDAYKALGFKYGDFRFWQGVGEFKQGKLKALITTKSDIDHWPWLKPYMIPGISEEFEAYVRGDRRDRQASLAVFKNPTRKELSEIPGDARYIINFKTKELYVWDAHEAIHNTVISQLKLKTDTSDWSFNDTFVEHGKLYELVVVWNPSKEKEPDLKWTKAYFNNIKILKVR